MKHKITAVASSSPLKNRVWPGYFLVSIGGKHISDVLDYKYLSYEARVDAIFEDTAGRRLKLRARKDEGQGLGLAFGSGLMDMPRSCRNRCVFCFIDQLPRGMRSTLYFKDDDARLSFLNGNYITLTNLDARDIKRIIERRISPVNISVHTTNPELRSKMLRNPKAARCLSIMRRLSRGGIHMNCQIVCCPGLNDGNELLRTLNSLKQLYPAVASVSVVPVGLTAHRHKLFPLRSFDSKSAGDIVDMTDSFGKQCLNELGTRLVYCADEFYLKAGAPVPPEEYYEDYPQLQNGVGMLRLFEREFIEALEASEKSGCFEKPFSIISGMAAAGFFQNLMLTAKEKYDKMNVMVHGVPNHFFGGGVDVAGLLTGSDLIECLRGKELGSRALIPANMLRAGGDITLDGMTVKGLSSALGTEIIPVLPNGAELLSEILSDDGG